MSEQHTDNGHGEPGGQDTYKVDPRTGTRPTDPFANPLALVVANRAAHRSVNPSANTGVEDVTDTPVDDTDPVVDADSVVDADAVADDLVDGPVFDAEVVDEDPADTPAAPGKAVALRRAGVATRRGALVAYRGTRTAVTHPYTRRSVKFTGRNLWYPVAGALVVAKRWRDAHGAGRYERMMRQAELRGDREMLEEWESRDVSEKQRRHQRVMDWVRSPIDLLRAIVVGTFAVALLLLGLGVILAIANKDIAQVIGPITAVISAIAWTWWFLSVYGAAMLLAVTAGGAVFLWHTGRTYADPPGLVATAPAGDVAGRDVVPDERAIVRALRNLNLGPLNTKFKEGWQPRWILAPCYDGKGWHAQLELCEGVNVPMIVDRKPLLAHNLVRLPVEVWPTEPRDRPGVLDLLVLDQGSMTKPVDPWPLLTDGVCDYFKGVPVGVNPMGRPVIGRLFQANWGVAGTMGSGKSTLIITMLLGAMLDPLVEIDVYCMAVNGDYDPLKPRLRTLFKSDDPDDVPTVLVALKQLMSELSERGRLLSAANETKLTRELAEADPRMRPRVVVIDECQELFVSEVGAEAAELVCKIVAKARKYGVTLIFATPVPSADSLPRNVAKVLSNKACFAIGDHQGNDAILGTGKHKAGITATSLRPMTEDADGTVDPGDIGTAMTVGFMAQDGLMRCYYPRRDKKKRIDEVTPVVERAMGLREGLPEVDPPEQPEQPEQGPDLLVDVATVMRKAERELMRTQEVISGLSALNPAVYGGFTFARLRDGLPEGAKPYKTKGFIQVSSQRVAEALADRDTTPDDPDGPDDTTDGEYGE